MSRGTKKFLALLLTVIMFIGMLPMTVLAADHANQVRVIVENTTFTAAVAGKEPAWTGKLVDKRVDINNNSTMMSALLDALGNYEQTGAEQGFVTSIHGLNAGDGGDWAGWMGMLNDWFVNDGFGTFTVAAGTLAAGDEIRIMYSKNGGEDLGGTWFNNDKTIKDLAFSAGKLSPAFNKDTHNYTLTLPKEINSVVVTPTASNKNFQVRTSVGDTEYKRSAKVPVENGTVITVKCGDPAWPSMNGGAWGTADNVPAEIYTINVVKSQVETPVLTTDLNTEPLAYEVGEAAEALVIAASEPSDGGTLSYQWYSSTDNAEFTAIDGATGTSYIPSTATIGTTYYKVIITNTFNAETATKESAVATVTVSQGYSKLESLIIHTGYSPSNTSVLLKNATDTYTSGLTFYANTLDYVLEPQLDTLTQLRFRPVVAENGAKATIHYGEDSKDITWTKGGSKFADCLTVGRNIFTIVVTPAEGSPKLPTTYTFTINCTPTLRALSIGSGDTQFYLDKNFAAATTDYTLTVPNNVQTVDITAVPQNNNYTLTYNENESNTVDISPINKIDIVVTGGIDENALNQIYSLNLNKVAQFDFNVIATPADAVVKVYDQAGVEIKANADGSYRGMFGACDYTYTVTKYGYVGQSGVVPKAGGPLVVTLDKAADDGLKDVGAYWPNFRGSDNNMAITDVELPTDPENTELKWNAKLGTGWAAAPSVQIIVDNTLIVMSETSIYKLDLKTGEKLVTGTMAAKPNYGYTPPAYAEGMIFAPLAGGRIQAFNAETLESLWIYKDNLGGQSLSPIVYSDGYIYTGFWTGETSNANFVCLSVTDEDVNKTDEAKVATWKHTQRGGFYWAGAVVVGDAVIVGTDDGQGGYDGSSKLYSFNKFTGKVISALDLTGDQRSAIAYDQAKGKIYFTTKCGYLYSASINAATGVISGLKGVKFGAQSTSTPVVYKGKVYFGTGNGLAVADANSLEVLYTVGLQGYPQCSMLLTTAYEDETGYIYAYSTYNAPPGGISMIQIDPTATTADGAELIELYDAEGFSQWCICSIICGPDGTLYYKNDSANVLAVGATEAAGVMKLIKAIGIVTADSGESIATARNAYDALSAEQKAKVKNYDDLTAAEEEYDDIMERIDAVKNQIENIGTVQYDAATKDKINAARTAYDQLSEIEQKYVDNYAALINAEAQYQKLQNAQRVSDLIDDIGEVTKDSDNKINAARQAYDTLSDEEKALVANYNTLVEAEAALKAVHKPKMTQQPPVWSKGSGEPASFTSDADFADFLHVKVDDEVVDESNYDVKEGSTVVTFKPAFLETLSEGKHSVEIVSVSGSAHGIIEIKAETKEEDTKQTIEVTELSDAKPKTGEGSGQSPWLVLLLLSAGGLIFLTLNKRRLQKRE